MNILHLVIITVLIVALLSFLMPWVSKKIEEPFQGSSSSCQAPDTRLTYNPIARGPADSRAEYVELGKQRYNFLGFLQSLGDRRIFTTADSRMGSVDNAIPDAGGPSPLQILNTNIRSALETVEILPRDPERIAAPDIVFDSAPTASAPAGTLLTRFRNAAAATRFYGDKATRGKETSTAYGYVEERLPPLDDALANAATCEVRNMNYEYQQGAAEPSEFAYPRSLPLNRASFCAKLKSDTTDTDFRDAFGSNTNKVCGFCVKSAQPFSPPAIYHPSSAGKSYNGIGGMYISREDMNSAPVRNGRKMYRPTLGSCAEGYFFVPDTVGSTEQYDACMKAAQQINCKEIEEAGGFNGGANVKSLDNTTMSDSGCRACVRGGGEVMYAYYTTPTSAKSILMRAVVPAGTGRTIITLKLIKSGQSSATTLGTFTLVSSSESQQNEAVGSGTTELNQNTFYYIISNTGPDDTLDISIAQEFPHRPTDARNQPQVFFAGFPTGTTSVDFGAAEKLAKSLNCTVATKGQLIQAQRDGMQFCDVGFGQDISGALTGYKNYVVRSNTISENPFVSVTGTGFCEKYRDIGGVQEISGSNVATGVWCWGIKPMASYLSDAPPVFDKPYIANFYTYYTQTNETSVSPTQKQALYSNPTVPMDATSPPPNYRGVCIQLERFTTQTPTSGYEPINIGIEPFLTKVGTNSLDTVRSLSDRLRYYSRNGKFGIPDGRITSPTYSSTGVFSLFNSSQYWLWSADPKQPTFNVSVKIPGFFDQPTHREDEPKCRMSVLYSSVENLSMVVATSCDNGLDDADRSGCIASLFRMAGGDLATGTLSPNTSDAVKKSKNIKQLLYKDYDANAPNKRLQVPRTPEEIRAYLLRIVEIARGDSESLRNLTDAERLQAMNEASQKLYGRDRLGPCDRLVQDAATGNVSILPKTAPFDAQCLDFLYRNTVPDSKQGVARLQTPTYDQIGTRFSGLDYPGGEYTTATADEIAAFSYKACQPTGTWAPIQGGNPNVTAVAEINQAIGNNQTAGISDIQKAIDIFNYLHKDANSNTASITRQEEAVERCYGIRKKTFATNCNGIAGSSLSIFTINGIPVGKNDIDIIIRDAQGQQVSPSLVTETQGTYSLTSYGNALTTTAITILNNINFPLNARDILDALVIQKATMIGDRIPGKSKSVDYIAKVPISGTAMLVYFAVIDGTNTRMVSVEFQVSGKTVQAKLVAARLASSLPGGATLNTFFDKADNIIVSTVSDEDGSGYGIRGLRVGLAAKRYSGITSTTDMGSCLTSDQRTFGAPLSGRGCDISCCEVYTPSYNMPSSTNVQSVEITKKSSMTLTSIANSNSYIVMVLDASGVVAQNILRFPSSVSVATLNFLQEDVRPLIPYRDIDYDLTQKKPRGLLGTTLVRLESAVGRRYFLQSSGSIQPVTESDLASNSASKFQLVDPRSGTASSETTPAYSISQVDLSNSFLSANIPIAGPTTVTAVRNAVSKADWIIRPAINGAYAFVSLELATFPGYYLVAEPNASGDGNFTARVKVVNPADYAETFYACWRLYPV